MEDRTIIMPVIALRGLAVLPQMIVHFDISRSRSKAALERVMVSDQQVFWLLSVRAMWRIRLLRICTMWAVWLRLSSW